MNQALFHLAVVPSSFAMPPTSESQTADHGYGDDDGSLSFPLSSRSSPLEATPRMFLLLLLGEYWFQVSLPWDREGFDTWMLISGVFGGPPIPQDCFTKVITVAESRGWSNPTRESLQRSCIPKMGIRNWWHLRLFKRESFTGSNFHVVFQGWSMNSRFTQSLVEPQNDLENFLLVSLSTSVLSGI